MKRTGASYPRDTLPLPLPDREEGLAAAGDAGLLGEGLVIGWPSSSRRVLSQSCRASVLTG